MTRALLLLPFLLAACTVPVRDGGPGGPGFVVRGQDGAAAAPPPLPPQVLAALPPGVPPTVVTRNADGCYLVTLERTNPPMGYPLRDPLGNRVCDGVPVAPVPAATPAATPAAAPVAAPVAAPLATPAVSTAPLDPAAAGVAGGPPVATAVLGAPPPPGQEPLAPPPPGLGPLAPGDITPPAPIVPPNPT